MAHVIHANEKKFLDISQLCCCFNAKMYRKDAFIGFGGNKI